MKWEDYHEEMMKNAEYKAEYDALEEEYNELRRRLNKTVHKPRFRRYSLSASSIMPLMTSASTKVPSCK